MNFDHYENVGVAFIDMNHLVDFSIKGSYRGVTGTMSTTIHSPQDFLEYAYGRNKNFDAFNEAYTAMNKAYMKAWISKHFKYK